MDKTAGNEPRSREALLSRDRELSASGDSQPYLGLGMLPTPKRRPLRQRIRRKLARAAKATFVPRQPSLVIFTSVAVAATLLLGLIVGIVSARVSSDVAGTFRGFLLVAASLPPALLTTMFLALIIPYRAYASSSTLIGLLSSYSPYVLGALTGIWSALLPGKLMPFGYDSLPTLWKWTIALGGPATWLLMGLVSNHLAAIVARRRDYERSLEELMESRHRVLMVHEQTRKDVAGLLHGRVQSRLVVLGHWLKTCQDQLKDGPKEAMESLEQADKLLREIRDEEIRSITRQLYPSIIRTGLPSALNSLADRFRSMFTVELDVDEKMAELESPVKPSLDESLRLTLYRVAEEALSNVAKHAQAQEAWVTLTLSPSKEVRLVVRDNGHGFEPPEASNGQGLLSMEDYVTALGGTVEVKSALERGTMVVASVPMSRPTPPKNSFDPKTGGLGL